MELHIKIKELREEKELSHRELAKILGVAYPRISEWENQKVRPSYESLIKMAQLFNVTTDYLLGLEN